MLCSPTCFPDQSLQSISHHGRTTGPTHRDPEPGIAQFVFAQVKHQEAIGASASLAEHGLELMVFDQSLFFWKYQAFHETSDELTVTHFCKNVAGHRIRDGSETIRRTPCWIHPGQRVRVQIVTFHIFTFPIRPKLTVCHYKKMASLGSRQCHQYVGSRDSRT